MNNPDFAFPVQWMDWQLGEMGVNDICEEIASKVFAACHADFDQELSLRQKESALADGIIADQQKEIEKLKDDLHQASMEANNWKSCEPFLKRANELCTGNAGKNVIEALCEEIEGMRGRMEAHIKGFLELREENLVLQSQIENHDVMLQQVRINTEAKIRAEYANPSAKSLAEVWEHIFRIEEELRKIHREKSQTTTTVDRHDHHDADEN